MFPQGDVPGGHSADFSLTRMMNTCTFSGVILFAFFPGWEIPSLGNEWRKRGIIFPAALCLLDQSRRGLKNLPELPGSPPNRALPCLGNEWEAWLCCFLPLHSWWARWSRSTGQIQSVGCICDTSALKGNGGFRSHFEETQWWSCYDNVGTAFARDNWIVLSSLPAEKPKSRG